MTKMTKQIYTPANTDEFYTTLDNLAMQDVGFFERGGAWPYTQIAVAANIVPIYLLANIGCVLAERIRPSNVA